MDNQKKISVIILNWNGKVLMERFLPSVIKNTDNRIAEIVVADNGSQDASVAWLRETFPIVKIISFPENLGFAGGYNAAVREVDSEYVLLLNSDVEVGEDWLGPLYRLISSDCHIAAVQPKILSLNNRSYFEYAGACGGYIDRFGFPFCRGRIIDEIEPDEGQYDTEEEVFWCSGAALLFRRDLYLQAGGLDEFFFAHMEEIDLCWRVRNGGFKALVCPESVVWHLGGGTLPMNHPKKLMLNYRNNLLMLYKNMTRKAFLQLMSVRIFMDIVSAFIFFLKGEFNNVKAEFSAYRSFLAAKRHYTHSAGPLNRACIYPSSIAVSFFLKKEKKFLDLGYKLSSGSFVKKKSR